MRGLAKSRRRAVAAIAVSCLAAALLSSTFAAAAEHGLGVDPAAACAALSSAGAGATSVDAAALIDARPLAVALKRNQIS
jgi:hypothetical protein